MGYFSTLSAIYDGEIAKAKKQQVDYVGAAEKYVRDLRGDEKERHEELVGLLGKKLAALQEKLVELTKENTAAEERAASRRKSPAMKKLEKELEKLELEELKASIAVRRHTLREQLKAVRAGRALSKKTAEEEPMGFDDADVNAEVIPFA